MEVLYKRWKCRITPWSIKSYRRSNFIKYKDRCSIEFKLQDG